MNETAVFKTKDGATEAEVDKTFEVARRIVDQILCLLSLQAGKATGVAASHGHRFKWGVRATLNKLGHLPVCQQHPDHQL